LHQFILDIMVNVVW